MGDIYSKNSKYFQPILIHLFLPAKILRLRERNSKLKSEKRVYFVRSIPGWITVDARDSRCIKAATDKFLLAERKKTAFSRR